MPTPFHPLLRPSTLVATTIWLATALKLGAQTDDFNDGNDAGWSRYNVFQPLGLNLASWSFPNGGYRIRTTQPSPDPSQLGPGRTGSMRAEPAYTDFYVSVDVIVWNDSLDQAFGVLARVTNPGLGSTDGYAFTYQTGDKAVSISRIFSEQPRDVTGSSASITLDPSQKYRLVLLGKGPNLEGRVYQLPDVTTPLLTVNGTDEAHTQGIAGLVVFDNTTLADGTADATFDNYFAAAEEPAIVTPPELKVSLVEPGQVRVSWPASPAGFVLQRAAAVGGSANWADVTAGITEAGGTKAYTESAGNNPTLFRLKK